MEKCNPRINAALLVPKADEIMSELNAHTEYWRMKAMEQIAEELKTVKICSEHLAHLYFFQSVTKTIDKLLSATSKAEVQGIMKKFEKSKEQWEQYSI